MTPIEIERWHLGLAEMLQEEAQRPGADAVHLLVEASRHQRSADALRKSGTTAAARRPAATSSF